MTGSTDVSILLPDCPGDDHHDQSEAPSILTGIVPKNAFESTRSCQMSGDRPSHEFAMLGERRGLFFSPAATTIPVMLLTYSPHERRLSRTKRPDLMALMLIIDIVRFVSLFWWIFEAVSNHLRPIPAF
jgi:hypothetical protein